MPRIAIPPVADQPAAQCRRRWRHGFDVQHLQRIQQAWHRQLVLFPHQHLANLRRRRNERTAIRAPPDRLTRHGCAPLIGRGRKARRQRGLSVRRLRGAAPAARGDGAAGRLGCSAAKMARRASSGMGHLAAFLGVLPCPTSPKGLWGRRGQIARRGPTPQPGRQPSRRAPVRPPGGGPGD